ncbi:hypothetical protein SPHINGO361_140164 [Sphingomonas sp. EC-HK361]|nr:hypothetical protein SPHINGO361_140164 [Sphingomonas sp. EC-HK361]
MKCSIDILRNAKIPARILIKKDGPTINRAKVQSRLDVKVHR